MTEKTMNNVREKLSRSREMCPGLSKEVYALTDYMASVANDKLLPQGMLSCLVLSMIDIRREINGFSCEESNEFPEYLSKHKLQILAQAVYFPQVIDAIADEDFANEFRKICKELLQFDPPKREEKYNQNAEIGGDYPEYVKVAVNWWANAIVNPKFDNGDDSVAGEMTFLLAMMVNSKNSISKEQIAIFKKELAQLIIEKMDSSFVGECRLGVDFHPDRLLYTAAQKAGIDNNMGFPWKTNMRITKNNVSVSAGYAAPWETLWEEA